jgi:CRP-like cAMP-binding protein
VNIEMSNIDQDAHPLVRKLESIADLTREEKEALLSLPMVVKTFSADNDIVCIGQRPSESCLLLDGWTCRYKMLPDGGRQIMSFHIPGDVPDFQSLYLKTMDHSLGTLTPVKVALIQHRDLQHLVRRYEGLATAFWRDSLIDAAIFREWMVGMGRRTAASRIAHLLCEVYFRLNAVGLARNGSITFPVTQEQIGDGLGLSTVHVNRSLQTLRKKELITLRSGTLRIDDWPGLCQVAEFDPIYLHADPLPRRPE